MLKPTSNCTDEMRMLIYNAFQERHNDPELTAVMPNLDVKKVIDGNGGASLVALWIFFVR